jgi:hypothetical protein
MRPVAVRFIDREQRWTRRSTNRILWFFEILLVILRPLGITSVIVQVLMVGRSGLDPGTFGVFRECPGVSRTVQICWPIEVASPPKSSEVLSHLNSWLDNWPDQGSFQGVGTVQFRGADRAVLELRVGVE